jgi:hypothetical protein
VVVFDNAPYLCIQVNKHPSKYLVKADDFMASKAAESCDASMRKYHQLYKLTELKRPKEKTYRSDQILNTCGHVVLRLPPYNCDLSPTELFSFLGNSGMFY